MSEESKETLKIGDLVKLVPAAIGYPMFTNAEKELGVGIVLEERTQIPEWGDPTGKDTLMYRIFWNGTNTKRWEFLDDLIKVVYK